MDSRERAGLQKRGEQQEAPSDSPGRRRTGPWQRGSARCRGHQRSPAAHTLGSSPGTLLGFPAGRGHRCGQGPILSGFDFEEAPGKSAAEGRGQLLSAALFTPVPECRQPNCPECTDAVSEGSAFLSYPCIYQRMTTAMERR